MVLHGETVPNRERDEAEARNYYRALDYLDTLISEPGEVTDVATLMGDLFTWLAEQRRSRELPVPITAALAHYQFATIHPYFDGNGRTARLLTTLLLHQASYGLKGIYSLEEYYARDLEAYYAALTVSPSHNYYMGRVAADLSGWIEYSCLGVADAFASVRTRAVAAARTETRKHHCANWMPDSVKSRPCSRPNLTSPPSKSPNTWGSIGAPR